MGGSSGSGDSVTLKGPALMLRRRRTFLEEPERHWHSINTRMKELLNVEEVNGVEQPWSAEGYGKEIPWDSNKLARRSYFLLAKIHNALRSEKPALAKGLVAQGLKFYERIALDHGSQEAAALLLPFEEVQASEARAAPLHAQDPFAGLIEAEEAALSMRYLTDIHNFNKIKLERTKGGGKGKKKGDEAPADSGAQSRPPKK